MLKIWLIDDDKISLFISEKIIEATFEGYEIIKFDKSIAALKHFQQVEEKPDIVFLDLNMPLLNGWDFLKEIDLKKNCTTDFYILSSSLHLSELIDSQKFSIVKGFIPKPLTKEAIIKILPEKEIE